MKSFVALILILAIAYEIPLAQESEFEAHAFVNSEKDTLNYRLLLPENFEEDKNYPVVLFLHGAGERGSDNESQLAWGVKNFAEEEFRSEHPAIVIAPQVPEDEYWANLNWREEGVSLSEEPRKPLALAYELLQQVVDEYPSDPNRIYITGLSMGGFGTWDLIARHPDTFAAAMPVCGGGDLEQAQSLVDKPIWNFHGGKDDVVPPELSREMISAIREAGGTPGYTEYPDVGHDSWIPAYGDRYALEWLFSQSRGDTTDSR